MKPTVSKPLSPVALAWLAEIGITPDLLAHHRPSAARDNSPAAALKALRQAAAHVPDARPVAQDDVAPTSSTPTPVAELPDNLQALQEHAAACQACALHEQRHLPVLGIGETQDVDWMVIGEAPGKDDDRNGLPLQGEAGALMVAMLAAVGRHPQSLGRQDVAVPPGLQPLRMYFANLVKCRPLGNRGPQPEEIAACQSMLMQQIRLVSPRKLLLLGEPVARALLGTDARVEALRQKVHTFRAPWGDAIPAMVTWHPAALLLRPQNKPLAWEDMRYLLSLTD